MPPKKSPMTDAAIKELIAQGIADALVDYEANISSGNEHDSHNSGSDGGRTPHTARWFEKMESVFHISNCTVECQIKYATCTLLGSALTWWNSHVKTVGHDTANGMPWKTLMKMMTDKYCPRSEIKKLDIELWNLKVEKYIGGLPDMIQGNVMSARPKTMQEAIKLANDLMDQKVCTFAERQAENKKRLDNNPRDNHIEQPPYKRQNLARAYSAGRSEKKEYAGTLPLCNKCKFYHNGPCTVECANCQRVSHLTRDCRNPTAANNQRTLTCSECGNQMHYRSDCLELKNRNHGHQSRNGEAYGRVYALGGGETNQDPNNIEGEIKA
ncbi:RNA-directed DNA polymerase, eukaryota [Tanacetum coccineum]